MANTTVINNGTTKPIVNTDSSVGGGTGHRPEVWIANGNQANGNIVAPTGVIVTVQQAQIDYNTSGDHTLIAGTGGKTTRVIGVNFVCSAAVSVAWKSSGGAQLVPAQSFAANGGNDCWRPQGKWADSVVGEGIVVNLSGAVQVSGTADYIVY